MDDTQRKTSVGAHKSRNFQKINFLLSGLPSLCKFLKFCLPKKDLNLAVLHFGLSPFVIIIIGHSGYLRCRFILLFMVLANR